MVYRSTERSPHGVHGRTEAWEVRAARHQALFRAVNEELRNARRASNPSTLTIACECADVDCVETIDELAAATEIAIARLRDLDDPAHMTLSDLQAFRDRLADDLGRQSRRDQRGPAELTAAS